MWFCRRWEIFIFHTILLGFLHLIPLNDSFQLHVNEFLYFLSFSKKRRDKVITYLCLPFRYLRIPFIQSYNCVQHFIVSSTLLYMCQAHYCVKNTVYTYPEVHLFTFHMSTCCGLIMLGLRNTSVLSCTRRPFDDFLQFYGVKCRFQYFSVVVFDSHFHVSNNR